MVDLLASAESSEMDDVASDVLGPFMSTMVIHGNNRRSIRVLHVAITRTSRAYAP